MATQVAGNNVKVTLTSVDANPKRREILENTLKILFPNLSTESPTFTRLLMCMEELTVNATKKQEQFPVEITFSRAKIDDHEIAQFIVKDSGKPFVLPERQDPLKTKGHGIGLTLVEKITKAADGDFGVDGKTNTAWFDYKIPAEDKME